MTKFVRFPKTPHLKWLGSGPLRDNKVLSPVDAKKLLSHSVVVEEKLDGANVGLSVGDEQILRVQNRGGFLPWDSLHPQFSPLRQWIDHRRHLLLDALSSRLILFGEWCYARHSIHYTHLPDWFVVFDVYDRSVGRFWSTKRRDAFALELGLAIVPQLGRGSFDIRDIACLLGPSRFVDGPAEGVYVRWDCDDYLERRAKLVRAEFTHAIGAHWTQAPFQANQVVFDGRGALAHPP